MTEEAATTEAAAETEITEAAATETATAGETTTASTLSVENLQKELTKVRQEAASYRVAKNAETDRVNAILKAAGIKTDEPDPVEVARQSSADAIAAKRELAIFKAAGPLGVNPTALLDSLTFKTSVDGLDPSDGAAITTAIQAALAANPTLKAVQAAAASGTELGGSGETGQITEQQFAAMSPEQIDKAFREGKLKHLL